MKRITAAVSFAGAILWASMVLAACPTANPQTIEAYIYGCPTITGPFAGSLIIPAVPNSTTAPTGSLQGIAANLLVTLSDTQTLANKTFTSPTINGATLSGTIAGNFTFSGTPIFSGLSVGTCASGLALDSGNHLVTTSCGGGGTSPGGSSGQVQWNNSAAFGGTSGLTVNATKVLSMSVGLGSDATGDIYYNSGGGALTRLGIGINTYVLTSNGSVPLWAPATGGGSGTVASSTIGQIPVYTAATTVTGTPNITFSSGLLKLDTNASASIPAFATTTPIFQMAAPDGTATRLGLATFGSGATGGILSGAVGGTAASPTPAPPGANLGTYAAGGFDGTSIDASGAFTCSSAESGNFSGSAHGTFCDLRTTAVGTTPLTSRMRVGADGSFLVPPAVTGGSLGAGWFNVSGGYAVNGTPIGGATTFFSSSAATTGGPVTYALAMSGYTAVSGNVVCTPSFTPTNGASPTLNIQSTGAKPIKLISGTGLLTPQGAEIPAAGQMCFLYDGANYVLQTSINAPPALTATDTVTAAKWATCQDYVISTASQTITLPSAAGLPVGGCISIQTIGVPASLCATGTDVINNGAPDASAAGGCVFVPADLPLTQVNSSGSAGATAFNVPLGNYQYRDQTWAEGTNLSANARFVGRFRTERAIYGIRCNVQAAAGTASTIHLFSTASGAAPASGTPIDTTGCNANTAANAEQDMGVAGSHILANYTVWAVYSGAGTSGSGGFTITFR